MAQAAVVNAVVTFLQTYWTHCPVVGLNEDQTTPEEATPFLEPQFPVSRSVRMSVSNRYYQESGSVLFVLGVERGIGLARAAQWADELATMFRDNTIDGVKFLVPSSPSFGDENDDGTYFIVTVIVPYTYDYED